MSDQKKTALLADEQDILAFAKKIERNRIDDELFSAQVDRFLSGEMLMFETLSLGHTPDILRLLGSTAEMITMKQNVIRNSMLAESEKTHGHLSGHDISSDIIKRIPEHLRNPILILEGQHPKTVVVVTELKDRDKKNIIVPVALDLRGVDSTVNKVTSIYGKEDILKYLNRHKNQILAYHKEKADELFTTIGFQLPQTTSAICFDDSIAYSTANVKRGMEQSLQQSLTVDGKTGAISSQDIIIDPKQVQQTAKPEKKKEGFFLGRAKRDSVRRNAAEATKKETPTQGADTPKHSNDAPGL